MTRPIAIDVHGLSKRFNLQRDRRASLKERVVKGRPARASDFWALRDVSFQVPRGSFFGVIGHNGSGKSTALKILAGIYRPTSGTVTTDGRVSALLELGAGFHPELTGRENIQLNGAILGLTQGEIERSMDEIIEFAGVGDFIDAPVKVYSSGMAVRLGFSVAVKMDPEILIVDEVIAVGDEEFQRRCHDYLFELRQRGRTIVLVTHSMPAVESMCDEAVWLDRGQVAGHGPAVEVVHGYLGRVNRNESQRHGAVGDVTGVVNRIGSGEAQVTGVDVLDTAGNPLAVITSGVPCVFRLNYEASQPVAQAYFSLGFFTENGLCVSYPELRAQGQPQRLPVGRGHIDFTMHALPLWPGTYYLSTIIAREGHFYDHVDRGVSLQVRSSGRDGLGLVAFDGTWGSATAASTSEVAATD